MRLKTLQDYLLRLRKRIRPNKPMLICGLPDNGFVAKIAVDHLIRELNAIRVADVYSPSLPPQVVIRDGGLMELIGHQLYYAKNDMLLYTGDSQPLDGEGAYKLSQFLVKLAGKYNVKEIIILAAMIKGVIVEEPQVFVSATSKELVEEYLLLGAKRTNSGGITWMHGLILGEAAKAGLRATCLSSETKGDVPDPHAAQVAIQILGKRLKISLDLSKFGEQRKAIEETIKRLDESEPKEKEKGKPTYIG
jgi:uncharacterized protein (TIGR00162 family)